MAQTKNVVHPRDLQHGDRVTIADSNGNELTGLVRRNESDNQLAGTLTVKAFGKEIRIASWMVRLGTDRAGIKWTSDYAVIDRQLTLW